MKILIVNTLFPPHRVGGAEKSVALLAAGLAAAGDSVAVATLDAGDTAATEVLANGVRVHRLPLDNLYWPFGLDAPPGRLRALIWHLRDAWNRRAAARLGAVIDAERPDVVHTNNLTGFSPAAWATIRRRGVPIVQTLRDYWPLCTRVSLFRKGQPCVGRCLDCRVLTLGARVMSGAVGQMVSNSDYVIARHVAAGYFPDVPARRIFNVVDLPAGPRVPASAAGAPLVFGFIGRIEEEKGIGVVLAACARLGRGDWRLRIAGAGKAAYVAALQRRYAHLPIEWVGFAEAGAFYASIDVVLVASIWPEPLPRTLIEALGAGVAAICADAGGIPEIAGLGRRSVTYPAQDVAALHAALTAALDDAPAWRQGGFRDAAALALFSERRIVAAYRAAYAAAIRDHRG